MQLYGSPEIYSINIYNDLYCYISPGYQGIGHMILSIISFKTIIPLAKMAWLTITTVQ